MLSEFKTRLSQEKENTTVLGWNGNRKPVTHPVEKVCPPPLRMTYGDCADFCFSMSSAVVFSGVSPEFIFCSACTYKLHNATFILVYLSLASPTK